MSWRFRKSVSLGKGVRLDVGKKGIGLSAGVKGMRVGVGSRGPYTSVSIPGTGLYSVRYLGKTSKAPVNNSQSESKGCLIFTLGIASLFIFMYIPQVGFSLLIIAGIAYFIWTKQPKQQVNKKWIKAMRFFERQEYEEAAKLLIEAHKLDRRNMDVIRLLGGALHNTEKFDDAIKYLQNALDRNPTDLEIRLILANCFYRTNRYKDAIHILQNTPEYFEENLKVIQLLGACFAAEKRYDLAIEVFKKAPLLKRNLDEDLMEIHYHLALAYEALGDKRNALKHFKKLYIKDIEYRNVYEKMKALEG